jgi:hypothetical protein
MAVEPLDRARRNRRVGELDEGKASRPTGGPIHRKEHLGNWT